MDYKNTLNLPQTAFSMKANLSQQEPKWIQFWQEIDLYRLLREKYNGKEKFILHDGPPYANGNIHIGHALNKILKDMIVKYNSMQGYDAPYVPGWDCHGLPVEHQLFKELNISKSQISQLEFRKKAGEYALKYVQVQKEEFRRLGVFGDWDNPYLTLKKEYVACILRSFAKLVEKGFIYKGLKPVNWCIRCETALAEAEVEYEEHHSPSIYVKFEITKDSVNQLVTNYQFLIWTTTPWTLVSNVAVAVHPELEYAFVKTSQSENFILAKVLLDSVMLKAGIKDYKIIKVVKGKELERLECAHPFIERSSLVVLDNYVSSTEGTGCVHIAPGHGEEDFSVGYRYKLAVLMPVDEKGIFDKTAGKFSGMDIFKANEIIINELKNNNKLLYDEKIAHSYPHCWRCKNPLITRATLQWFMDVDHKDLRKKIIQILDEITWLPQEGKSRIEAMIKNRPHWCLSRQRYWGVGIPAFYCATCNQPILEKKLIDYVADIVEKEGSDAWFSKEAKDLLPEGFMCPSCGNKEIKKETDILDVWFDSGVSAQAVLKQREDLSFPADLYLEGSDQHRGWFQAALIPSLAIEDKSCFKSVLTHGFVVDGEGRKMSKSVGNVIAPQEIIKDYGADILRLWVASSDYAEDIRISKEIILRLIESYRKIRNTFRFLLGNLSDFDPQSDCVAYDNLEEVDRWVLTQLNLVIKEATQNFHKYQFYKVYQLVYNFCSQELSAFYLDILKDRLYTFKKDSLGRRSAQTVLFEVLDNLLRIVAPILSFSAEEVYSFMRKKEPDESVHLLSWPKQNSKWQDEKLINNWKKIFSLRDMVLKEIEEKRIEGIIGDSQEAKIEIFVEKEEDFKFLNNYLKDLNSIFIVSQVALNNLKDDTPIKKTLALEKFLGKIGVTVNKAEGKKCARCWNYSKSVGGSEKFSDICSRCLEVLSEEAKPK